MMNIKPLKKTGHRFYKNTEGQIAVWFALLALPLLIITTFVIDYGSATKYRTEVKNALDAAALAAVIKQNLTEQQRKDYALAYIAENTSLSKDFKFEVSSAKDSRVEIEATGRAPVTISGILGAKGIDIYERSVSELTTESTICIMALNPTGSHALTIAEGAKLSAPTCAVQVNSSNRVAAYVDEDSKAVAKRFCVNGGGTGFFQPYLNTECSKLADPYEGKPVPVMGPCINEGIKKISAKGKHGVTALGTVTDGGITLSPGTYCQDIQLQGINVKLLPGIYFIDNARLRFKNGSTAIGEGVTFILKGDKAGFSVESGSRVKFSAPKTGDFKGLVIFQDVNSTSPASSFPVGKSAFKGGSAMEFLGTIYLPASDISVGNSGMNTLAPATSFIGYNVKFEGSSEVIVAVNSAASGLPAILPRADEGARLVE